MPESRVWDVATFLSNAIKHLLKALFRGDGWFVCSGSMRCIDLFNLIQNGLVILQLDLQPHTNLNVLVHYSDHPRLLSGQVDTDSWGSFRLEPDASRQTTWKQLFQRLCHHHLFLLFIKS